MREDCDKSQSQIAAALGVSPSTVSGWETENRQMDYDTLIKIADYFDVSIDYLLGRDHKVTNLSDSEKHILSSFRSLHKENKTIWLKILDVLLDNQKGR